MIIYGSTIAPCLLRMQDRCGAGADDGRGAPLVEADRRPVVAQG